MGKEREIGGIKVIVSNETYNEYKGTLQDQINELQDRIDKALEIYENRNSIKFKKQRFMEDKDTGDLMYDILKGEDKE